MDTRRKILIRSILSFLRGELNGDGLDKDKKESLEVGIQCLETTFDVDSESIGEMVDLLPLIKDEKKVNIENKLEISEEQMRQAEIYKTKGNDFMKTSQYHEAIDEYTKAIELNPNNAVFFCNRAAAYTRLLKDIDAINDCHEAIKLDPTYGKAYGRLGIAYSNQNKLELAVGAYQTALKYDPSNAMYETNLKVAQERIRGNRGGTGSIDDVPLPPNLADFIDNPNIINIAGQILGDQNFHNMMSSLIRTMSTGPAGDGVPPAVESMLQAGSALAQRVVTEDPDFYNRIARQVNSDQAGANSNPPAPNDSTRDPSDKDKDQGST